MRQRWGLRGVKIIVWVVLGAVAGWLASLVMKTNKKQGLLQDIVGAFIGGFVLNFLDIGGGVSGLNIPSLITAFVGAVILLGILRMVR